MVVHPMQNCRNSLNMTDDIDRIMHVMGRAFDPAWGEAWNRRQITDSLMMPNIHYSLADAPDGSAAPEAAIAGFTLIRSAPGEDELLLIAVDPQYRGNGIGRQLLDKAIVDARRRACDTMFLEMRANNPAEKLYRAIGFEPIGRRKDYYRGSGSGPVDAITFGLKIK